MFSKQGGEGFRAKRGGEIKVLVVATDFDNASTYIPRGKEKIKNGRKVNTWREGREEEET